jgi:chromosomal replication initiator protein
VLVEWLVASDISPWSKVPHLPRKSSKAAVAEEVTRILLERPASVRRLLPSLSDGWALDDYIIGSENEGLRFLFLDETIVQLENYSPIVFYGDKHLGKTALAITLAVRWSRLKNLRPLCFTTGTAFAQDFSEAVEIDDIDSFRKRLRHCKMLVIDNFDPLASKPAAQDELAATLDHMLELGLPVIVTASRLPPVLKGLKPALASRLAGGYSIGLAKPNASTRAELVRSLIATINQRLPEAELTSLCTQLAGNSPLSAFELRDIVTIAHQNLTNSGSLDMSVVAALARQLLSNEVPTIPLIAKLVARKLRVKLVDLRASTREATVVRSRGLAILLSREFTTASLQEIGLFFGGRDHSTILHAHRKTLASLESDSELANCYRDLKSELINGHTAKD